MTSQTVCIFTGAGMRCEAGEPFAAQTPELAVGRTSGGFFPLGDGGILSGLPSLDKGADVTLEYLGEVVVAVELVFVRDACETLNGLCDGPGRKG